MAVPAEPATRTWPRKITALRDRLLRVLGKSFNIVNVLIRKQQMGAEVGKGPAHILYNKGSVSRI